MNIIQRNSIHLPKKSYDVAIITVGLYKIKLTYEACNANERCTTELFDGYKFNHIFSLMDLGETPETSAYNTLDEKERKVRATYLFGLAEKMTYKLLTA